MICRKTCGSLRSVGVRFHDHQVLNDISLEIEANAITVLIGRSGSGKTTFLRILNRLNELFENCHTAGQIILEIRGRSLDIYDSRIQVELLRRKVGMVFQNPNLLPLSIYRNIAMPLRIVTGA
ncbi:MAG: phosphate transport system ATP-binding protein, partial [Thermodesulfobacteriota bacterium]|nr:phosphate transport system ATP-binding protein [Thermodesulfobacteriota bacterium]